jgi:hypothetical protein
MEPTKEAHPAKAAGKHMLEKAADQFGGSQRDGLLLPGLGIAIGPEHLSGGQALELAIARGGLEDIARQVSQGLFSGTDCLAVYAPVLLPNLLG